MNTGTTKTPKPVVLFTGGATGGHLYPGLAVAQEMREHLNIEPRFLRSGERPIEARILEPSGFESHALEGGGRGARGRMAAFSQARRLLRQLDPAAVIGLGGGPSVPPAIAARLGRRPLFLLEQNRVVGRANRLLGPFATRVFLSFEDTMGGRWLRRRAVRVGCPVRRGFAPTPPPAGPVVVLVLGGSQGAEALNALLIAALPLLAERRVGALEFIHLAGDGKGGELRASYAAHGYRAGVHEYCDDPASLYAQASLVIARAGGSTCAEIIAAGRGALLLPYPHHKDRQQFHNAEALVRAGAAEIMSDDPRDLAARIAGLAGDRARLATMGLRAAGLGAPGAARRIAEIIATHLECIPEGAIP